MTEIVETKKETLQFNLPKWYPLNMEKLRVIQKLNPSVRLNKTSKYKLRIEEAEFSFNDFEWIELSMPTDFILNEDKFNELEEINGDNEISQIELDENGLIILKMGTFSEIAALTAMIISSFVVWASIQKKGRVYPENGGFSFLSANNINGFIVRLPDVSYIDFAKAPKEVQASWKQKRIPIPPTLAIEIVSSKYGLKPALKKAEEVWMHYGSDLCLVICPFSEKLYIFEQGKGNYTEQSIYEPFSHPLLPGYEVNFGDYLKELE
jgi:Uma2 family endonuclease